MKINTGSSILFFNHIFRPPLQTSTVADCDSGRLRILLFLRKKIPIYFVRHCSYRMNFVRVHFQVKKSVEGKLDYIIVDDCCASRACYVTIFGENILVKLDIWHAIKRLVHVIPKKFEWRAYISKRLGLIVRQDGDWGEERVQITANPAKIMENLSNTLADIDQYLQRLPSNKYEELLAEIKKIKVNFKFLISLAKSTFRNRFTMDQGGPMKLSNSY